MPLLNTQGLLTNPLAMAGLGLLSQPTQSRYPINPMAAVMGGMQMAGQNQYDQQKVAGQQAEQVYRAEQLRLQLSEELRKKEELETARKEQERQRAAQEAAFATASPEEKLWAQAFPEEYAKRRFADPKESWSEPFMMDIGGTPTLVQKSSTTQQLRKVGSAGAGGGVDTPATILEWQAFQRMTPEEQNAYLLMKRANPFVNLGGEQVQYAPAQPGVAQHTAPVTPRPEEMPAFKAEQATAVATAEAGVKRDTATAGIADTVQMARDILEGKTGDAPTQSGFGAATDTAAGYFGVTPKGAPEADQLRAIGGALVSKMPRMEGPQSDKDVQTYREMAGQVGDATVPIARRLAALKVVEQLYSKYAGGNPVSATGQIVQDAPTLQPGHVEDGYEYVGGDPAQPASWRKK